MRPTGNIDEVLTPEAPRPPEVTRQGRVVTYKWTTAAASGGHTIEVVFYRQGDDSWEVSSLVDGSVWADRSPKGQGVGLEFLRAEANALRHFLASTRPRLVFADVVRHGVEERGMRRNSRVRAQSRVLQRIADETGYVFSRRGATFRDEGGVRLQLSMPEGAAVNEALVQPADDAQTARGLTPESARVLADIYTRVDQPAFDKWLRDFAEVKDAKSEQDARHHFYSYLNDWLYEKYNVSVRTDGLIEFWQLSPRLVSILGDNRVVLYHVTGEKILPQIRKLGLLPATSKRTRTDAMYSTGAGVYLSSVSSGNQMDTYASNAHTRFGDYVVLTVRVPPKDLAPDPDDADIASGRTQFIVDHVPPEDVIDWGVPRESLTEREADPKRVRLIRRIVSHIRQRFLDLAKLAETDPAAADAQLHVPSDIAALNVKAAGGSWGIEFGHRELHTPELAKYGIHAVAIAPYNSADGSGPQASYIPTGADPYIRLHTNLDRNSPITARRVAGPFLSGERRYLDSLAHEVAHALDFVSRGNKADDSFVSRRTRGGAVGYYNSEHEVHAYVTQALKAFMDFVQMAEDWTLRAIARETTKTLDDVKNSQIGVPQLQQAMRATASVAAFIDGVLRANYAKSEKTRPLDKFADSMTEKTRKRVHKRIATFYPTARTAVRRAVEHVEKAATARFGAVSESALVEHLPLDGEEVWRIPQRDFLDRTITGHIGSSAYENYEKDGGLSWVPLSKYTEPLGSIDTDNGVVEFRGEAGLRRYAKRDPNDEWEWLRDDKGDIVYMSQDEIRAQGLTEKNPCVAAVNAGRVVGFASDEFGVPGVWVERAWQRKGIGMRLLELLSTRMKIKKMGQATPAGVEMSAKYHKLLVKQALRRGEPVPPEVLADYPDLVKTESILNERYTSNLAALWGKFKATRDSGEATLRDQVLQLGSNPYDPSMYTLLDQAGVDYTAEYNAGREKGLNRTESNKAILDAHWPALRDFFASNAVEAKRWMHRIMRDYPAEGAFSVFDAETATLLPPTTWLAHFTNNAESIRYEGFQYGPKVGAWKDLGFTPLADPESVKGGTFAFALEVGTERAAEVAAAREYGRECVLLQAAGVRVYHRTDQEEQVIFDGSSVRPDALIVLLSDGDDWYVSGVPAIRGDFAKVVAWVTTHAQQYRRQVSNGYWRGRWVGRPKRIERVNEASGSTSSYYDPGAEYVHYSSADFESFRRHGRNGQDAGAVFLVRADDEAAVQYASLYGKIEYRARVHLSPDQVFDLSNPAHVERVLAVTEDMTEEGDTGEDFLRGAKHHASGLDWATINGDVLMAAGFAAAVVGERPAGAHNPVTGQGYTHDVRSLAVFDPSVLALQPRKRVNEVLDVAGARPAIEWKYGGGMAKYTTTVDVGGVSYAVGVGFLRKTAAVWDLEYYVNDKVQASSVAKGAVFPILSFVHAAVRQFISDTRPREIHVYAYPHGEHDAKNMREQSRPIFTEKALQRLAQSVGYEYQGSRTADVLRARLVDPTYEDVVESQVNEGWIATVKNHRGVEDLFVDPSLLDLRKTILPPHHEARIFLLGEHAYVWKGGTSIHVEVERMKLVPGLDDSAIPLVGWFHPSTGQLMSVLVSDYSKRTRWHHKWEVKDAIQNHPWVMRVSRGGTGLVHISYYDDAIVGDWTEIRESQSDLTEAVPPEEDHKIAGTPRRERIRLHALGEWRIPDQSLIRLVSDHSGDRLDPAHTDIGRRLRESAIEERRTDKARLRTLNAVVDGLVSKVQRGVAFWGSEGKVFQYKHEGNIIGHTYRVLVNDARVPNLKSVSLVVEAPDAATWPFGNAAGWYSPSNGGMYIPVGSTGGLGDFRERVTEYVASPQFVRKVRSVMRHEVTHAMDPWVHNPKKALTSLDLDDTSYYNSDHEVHAYTTQALADEFDRVRTLAKEFAAAVKAENPHKAQLLANNLGVLARTNWKFPLWFQAILARYPSFGRAFTHMGEQERRRAQKRFYAAWLRLRRTLTRVYRAWERVLAVNRAKAKKDWEDAPADARAGFEDEKDYIDFVSPSAQPLPDDAHPKGWRISERYAGAEKDRRLWYHVAPAWALQRILSYGLLARPPVRGSHQDANEHADDLTSYGGVYFGNTPAVAFNGASANSGNRVLVVVSSTLRSQVEDEDHVTFDILHDIPKLRNSLTPGLLAMGVPLVLPEEVKQREKSWFDDKVESVLRLLTASGGGGAAYAQRVRELVVEAVRAALVRNAVYFARSLQGNRFSHSLGYELSAAETDVYFDADYWNSLVKHERESKDERTTERMRRLEPMKDNYELARRALRAYGLQRARTEYRRAVDKLTRTIRKDRTAPSMSGRVLQDVRWRGSTRIVCVLLQDRQGKYGSQHYWYVVGGSMPPEVETALRDRLPEGQSTVAIADRKTVAQMVATELRDRGDKDTPVGWRRHKSKPEHADFDSLVR